MRGCGRPGRGSCTAGTVSVRRQGACGRRDGPMVAWATGNRPGDLQERLQDEWAAGDWPGLRGQAVPAGPGARDAARRRKELVNEPQKAQCGNDGVRAVGGRDRGSAGFPLWPLVRAAVKNKDDCRRAAGWQELNYCGGAINGGCRILAASPGVAHAACGACPGERCWGRVPGPGLTENC
jgi:hypothetical protein